MTLNSLLARKYGTSLEIKYCAKNMISCHALRSQGLLVRAVACETRGPGFKLALFNVSTSTGIRR